MIEEVLGSLKAVCEKSGHIYLDDIPEDFLVIQEGDWISEHKYEVAIHILRHVPTDTHWMLSACRTGSYYTDYHYEPIEIDQVTPVQEVVTVTKWKAV